MLHSIISFILVATTLVEAHHTKHLHVKKHSKNPLQIIGGKVANNGDYPHQISMRYVGSHICGGSIIAPNAILTAYHCVQGRSAGNFRVVTGEVMLDQPGTKYEVDEIINHENADIAKRKNDISILRLKTNIVFNERVKQISYQCPAELIGKKAVVSGWGYTQYPNIKRPNQLMYLDNLTILSDEDCRSGTNAQLINEGSLCAFYGKGKGVCMGDSGGPLVIDGVQCGVVSWGYPCGIGYPDVYMRIPYYIDWINRKLNKI